MKKEMRELKNAVEREKKELIEKFSRGDIDLHEFVEMLKDIEFVENYLHGDDEKLELLDVREIRELAGKTLYISLPRTIDEVGIEKGTLMKIYVDRSKRKIVLEPKQ